MTYRVAPANKSGLESESVDLITVAQALHWMPLEALFQECQRVLKLTEILAVWTYGLFSTDNNRINHIIRNYYNKIVELYWPPQRSPVDECYRLIKLPFVELHPANLKITPLAIEEVWSLQQVKGYFLGWSASDYFYQAQATNPLDIINLDLEQAWGKADKLSTITLPLTLRITRKPYE